MKKYNTIKKGYRVTVTTWENDGDNYNTVTKEGIEDIVQLIIELQMLKLIDRNNMEYRDFANQYEVDEGTQDAMGAALHKLVREGNWQKAFKDKWDLEVDGMSNEDMYQVLVDTYYDYGAAGGGDSFAIRVVESIIVEIVPEDILLEDVTADFV